MEDGAVDDTGASEYLAEPYTSAIHAPNLSFCSNEKVVPEHCVLLEYSACERRRRVVMVCVDKQIQI